MASSNEGPCTLNLLQGLVSVNCPLVWADLTTSLSTPVNFRNCVRNLKYHAQSLPFLYNVGRWTMQQESCTLPRETKCLVFCQAPLISLFPWKHQLPPAIGKCLKHCNWINTSSQTLMNWASGPAKLPKFLFVTLGSHYELFAHGGMRMELRFSGCNTSTWFVNLVFFTFRFEGDQGI